VGETQDVNFTTTLTTQLTKLFCKSIGSLIVEMLRDDSSGLEINIELRLMWIDSFSKFKWFFTKHPELMSFKFVPINSLNRVFFEQLLY